MNEYSLGPNDLRAPRLYTYEDCIAHRKGSLALENPNFRHVYNMYWYNPYCSEQDVLRVAERLDPKKYPFKPADGYTIGFIAEHTPECDRVSNCAICENNTVMQRREDKYTFRPSLTNPLRQVFVDSHYPTCPDCLEEATSPATNNTVKTAEDIPPPAPEDCEDDELPVGPRGKTVAQRRSALNPSRYGRLPQSVLCNLDLKPTDKLVFAAMAMFSSNGICRLSLEKLTIETGLHESTVRNAIANLSWGKHIEINSRAINTTKSNGQSARYVVPYYILTSPVFKKKEASL